MPSGAVYAGNTILKKGGTTIAETRNARLSQRVNFVDTTPHKSTRDEEGLPGIISRELTFDVNWKRTRADHAAIDTDLNDGSSDSYSMTFADGAIATFNAIVLGLDLGAPHDAQQSGAVTFRLDGGITWS